MEGGCFVFVLVLLVHVVLVILVLVLVLVFTFWNLGETLLGYNLTTPISSSIPRYRAIRRSTWAVP